MSRTIISRLSRKKLLVSSSFRPQYIPQTLASSPPIRFLSSSRHMATPSKMLQSNRLKQAFLVNKGPSMGVWQMIPGSNVSRILASAGAEWVVVDCEHGNIDGERSSFVLLTG